MKIQFKKTIAAALTVLFLAAGSVFAAAAPKHNSPEYLSARATTLLSEIQTETKQLEPHAGTLGAVAANMQTHWPTHAFYLEAVKTHINTVGQKLAELQRIRGSVQPWQQQAITQVTSHAAQVATSTQAALVYINQNQSRLFASEYRDHVQTIADRSGDLHDTVSKYLDYERAQQKVNQLQNELELAAN
jgi:hypothetical protein